MVARVGPHSDVTGLAEHSSCPVINALSDTYHPLQTLADFLTLHETYPSTSGTGLGLEGLRIAWVGDANNILFDLALGAANSGVQVVAATPKGYEVPAAIIKQVEEAAATASSPGGLTTTTIPEEAVKGADVIVTDTWISMGQETEKQARLKAFEGYQVTEALAKRGGAKADWKFMHCLPRKQEEVDDEVFYGPRSLVFPEGENRLWSAVGKFSPFLLIAIGW
jgi:ornithine carbamoyltransferase